jgi:low affinity Fe/Cu permease
MKREASNGAAPSRFQTFSTQCSQVAGSRWAFPSAVAIIFFWATIGPYFNYSDTWQLVVNTATTIGTFLMVFLIQNTQNRDARAMHLKLDELIRSMRRANNEMIDIEKLSDEDLAALAADFERFRSECESRKNARRLSKSNGRGKSVWLEPASCTQAQA